MSDSVKKTKPGGTDDQPSYVPADWQGPDGGLLDCDEKLLVLRENLREIDDIVRESLEDAVLMGVDELQYRDTLKRLIDHLKSPFADKK